MLKEIHKFCSDASDRTVFKAPVLFYDVRFNHFKDLLLALKLLYSCVGISGMFIYQD